MYNYPPLPSIVEPTKSSKVQLCNLLCQRVYSILQLSFNTDSIERNIVSQFKAWKRHNSQVFQNLLTAFSAEGAAGSLGTSENPALESAFEACALTIAENTATVLGGSLSSRVVHQPVVNMLREKRLRAQRLQCLKTFDKLNDYLVQYDDYLSALESNIFTLTEAIQRVCAKATSDDRFSGSQGILMNIMRNIFDVQGDTKTLADAFKKIVIDAMGPDLTEALALTEKRSRAIGVINNTVSKIFLNYQKALTAYKQLHPATLSALNVGGLAIQSPTEIVYEMISGVRKLVWDYMSEEYAKPAVNLQSSIMNFFVNTKASAKQLGRAFQYYAYMNTYKGQLVFQVYGENLQEDDLMNLYDFHLFVLGLTQGQAVDDKDQIERFYLLYCDQNQSAKPKHHQYYHSAKMQEIDPLARQTPSSFADLQEMINKKDVAAIKMELLRIHIKLNRLLQKVSDPELSDSEKDGILKDISEIQESLKILDGIKNGAGIKKHLSDIGFDNLYGEVFKPKIQQIHRAIVRSVYISMCLDILDDKPDLVPEKHQVLDRIYHCVVRGELPLSDEDRRWLDQHYPDALKDQLKVRLCQIHRLYDTLYEAKDKKTETKTDAKKSEHVPLRTRAAQKQCDEVEYIKYLLTFIQPQLLVQSIIDCLRLQSDRCKDFPDDARIQAKFQYCNALIAALEKFNSEYFSAKPVDFSQLAREIQKLKSQATQFMAKQQLSSLGVISSIWKIMPSLNSLLKMADHFGPSTSTEAQGYGQLFLSYLLAQMGQQRITETYHHYQAQVALSTQGFAKDPELFVENEWLSDELLNPLDLSQATNFVARMMLKEYIAKLADYYFAPENGILISALEKVFGSMVSRDNITSLLSSLLSLNEISDSHEKIVAKYYFKCLAHFRKYKNEA